MRSRFRWLGTALLASAAAIAIVLLVIFRIVGPARWPEDAIFVPRDVPTIQQALEMAEPGGTIVLRRQDEPFDGPLTIDVANVTLVSASGDARLVAGGSEPGLTVRADGVVIGGLEIVSESVGLRVEASRCEIEGVRVLGAPIGVQLHGARRCKLAGIEVAGGRIGMELVSSSGNALIDVSVRESSESGLRILGSSNNGLEGVEVLDTPTGVSLEQGSSENEMRACRIEGAANAGIEIRGSNDNLVVDSTIRSSGTGIALDGVSDNEIRGCEILGNGDVGVTLRQAIQNRVTENRIAGSLDAGILLIQSAENALSYNRIEEGAGAGIRFDGSDRNLISGNTLVDNGIGIDSIRSSHGRILRNTVFSTDRSGVGVSIAGGADNSLLDNHIRGGEAGCQLSDSQGNSLLRNRIEQQASVGLSIAGGSVACGVTENWFSDNLVGVLIAASSRSEILNNRIAGNDTGLLLVRSGSGVRIEGNVIEANRLGIRQADRVDIAGMAPLPEGEASAAIVANNLFVANEVLDILNEASIPFYAGGNWWGAAGERATGPARVSDGVLLEDTAWIGTLAIGTESDVSQVILGRILQYALSQAGFRVIDLIGMGDSQRVSEALRMQDVDFIWWGAPGALLPEEGEVDVAAIPAVRTWTVVVSEATSESLTEKTLSAFSSWLRESRATFRYAAPPSLGHEAAAAFEEVYGLRESVASVSWAETHGETEALLKFGAVEAAIVENLEETLTSSGFVALEDDLAGFDTAQILIAFRPGLHARVPGIEGVLGELVPVLTTSTIHDLIGRTRLLQREPAEVAWEFLVRQGILLE